MRRKQLCHALLHSDLCGWPRVAMQIRPVLELPAGQQQLKEYMSKTQSKPYWQRLADFHLLLYLSKQAGLDLRNDIAILLECIKHKAQVPDGYPLIIDSMAGL